MISDDTDVFMEGLLHASSFSGKEFMVENLSRTRTDLKKLDVMIRSDPRLQSLSFPTQSLVMAMALCGNDFSGSLAGFGCVTFLNTFLRFPVDLVVSEGPIPFPFSLSRHDVWPSFENFQSFTKALYFVKNENSLKKRIVDFER